MEAVSPVERRPGKGMKEQGGCKPPRSPLHPQEAGGPGTMATEPGRAWAGQTQGPSVLECKVRALKEKKMLAGKQTLSSEALSQERPSLKKAKSWRGKPGTALLVTEGASQDSVLVPQAQMRTYLTDRLLDSGDDQEPGPVHSSPINHNRSPNPENQRLPEGLWRPPDSSVLREVSYFQERPIQTASQNRPENTGSCRDVVQMLCLENGTSVAPAKRQIQVGDLDTRGDPTLQGQLWRASNWDHSLSLADRVERNRLLLQERRSLSERSSSQPPPAKVHDGPSPELPGGDLDWDSGVSLQDSDGCRAFVPSQELLQSPRHEQAKQLLQKARMKARTSPLRGNHDIIPTVVPRQPERDASGGAGHNPRVTLASRDGDAPYGGSLSDSSSGESSCGQRRKRGPSPSRVRFEDESAQDAEVRYQERLQQPQKRALDSMFRSLGQGPLVSKPDLSNYINGDFHTRDTQGDESCWGSSNKGTTGGLGGRSLPGKVLELSVEGTCHTCGSSLQGVSQDLDLRPTERKMPPGRSHSQEREDAWGMKKDRVILPTESSAFWGLASPVWILPSQQRLHTEHIRETYIGDITYPDEVDSALDSTDTSDSCRTDSEEAGTPHLRNRSRARGSGHSGHPRGRRAGGTQKRERDPETEKTEGIQAWHKQVEVEGRFEEGSSLPKEDQGPKLPVHKAEGISKEDQRTVVSPPLTIAGQTCKWTHPEDTQAPYGALITMMTSRLLAVSVPAVEAPTSGSQELLKSGTVSCPLPPNRISPTRISSHGSPQQAPPKKPAQPFTLGTWVPTPPTVKKSSSPVPYRRAMLTRTLGPDNQRDLGDAHPLSPRENDARLGGEAQIENQLSPPKIKHHLLVPSTNNFNNIGSREQCNIQRSTRESPKEKGLVCLEPEPSIEKSRDGGFLSLPESGGTSSLNSIGIMDSMATEQSQSNMETEDKPQRAKPSSGKNISKRTSPGAPSGPSTPSALPASGSKKGTSISSALGLKKFFSILGQTTRQKLGKFRCYSMEQIPPLANGLGSKMKKTPSLQSLQLASPSHQHRKAGSVQNLHSLLGKVDRSSHYLVGDGGEPRASGRQPGLTSRRSLSVDDIGVPNLVRTVGRIVEVFPDGTSQLELKRPPDGSFGFRVSSGNGRPDSGFYVQEIADANTAKLYSGLLGAGDEILEVNGAKVTGLGLALVNELLAQSESLSIRVLKQRGPPR
ncbi:uncharacterized protein KIAA1614 homolog [Macrotis lagotis]|uniref:uncharacterized protein KIAA1614 homolog n=1 Tax=Macrotis lagotis TaxID=92651 RepID=UPI003D696E8C